MARVIGSSRLRWVVVAALVVVLGGTGVGLARNAMADPSLPPVTAAQLLADLARPDAAAISGTISESADLGLPALPAGLSKDTSTTTLLSGTHTLRLWSDGPTKIRVATLGAAAESDIIRNGRDLWVWTSSDRTVTHDILPAATASGHTLPGSGLPSALPSDLPSGLASALASGMPTTPAAAAQLALTALAPTTSVTVGPVTTVAGRPAYQLVIAPKQSDSLVAKVVIAVDGQAHVPLRVQIFSTELTDPAFQVGFTSVDYSVPAADLFTFTPPPGATVTTHDLSAVDATHADTPANGPKPSVRTVGTAWDTVLVATLPADALAGATGTAGSPDAAGTSGQNLTALLDLLPRTSGSWGSGRVLSGTLFSLVLADDGRLAVGAVPASTLYAALTTK